MKLCWIFCVRRAWWQETFRALKDMDAPKAGLWRPQVEKGMRVERGQCIGTVEEASVYAPESGMVMNIVPCGYIFADDLWVMTYVQPAQ